MSAPDRVEQLYRDYGPRLLGYLARRVGDPHDAADLMGEVMVAVLRSPDRIPDAPDDLLWLYGVARNVRRNAARAGHRRDAATLRLAAALRVHAAPPADGTLLAQDVRSELAALAELDREIVTLSAWEGLSSAQIGEVLGMPAGSVRSRLHRARRTLGTRLDLYSTRSSTVAAGD